MRCGVCNLGRAKFLRLYFKAWSMLFYVDYDLGCCTWVVIDAIGGCLPAVAEFLLE